MNTYTKLQMHLERHMYKRGQYKGDAPADRRHRGKSHFRVVKHHDRMVVRLHSANIITAYPDGRVVIDTNGWQDYSTTRLRLNEAMGFVGFGQLCMRKIMGLSQPVFRVGNNSYRYYDGMEFDDSARLLSAPKPFEMRRIDKDESKEFITEVKASGFQDMFPLLYASTTPGTAAVHRMQDMITDADHAHRWPDIISAYKFERVYNYKAGKYELLEKGDAKSCWNAIMKECKKNMYVTLKSDITTMYTPTR
jgi:hypothetical protein